MLVFCKPGKDKAILLPPTFGMYQVCADINGVETLAVPLTKNFQLDVEAILAAQDKHTKMILLFQVQTTLPVIALNVKMWLLF